MQICLSKSSEILFFRFYQKSIKKLRLIKKSSESFSLQWSLRETTWCRKQISKKLIRIMSTHVYTVQLQVQLTFEGSPLLNVSSEKQHWDFELKCTTPVPSMYAIFSCIWLMFMLLSVTYNPFRCLMFQEVICYSPLTYQVRSPFFNSSPIILETSCCVAPRCVQVQETSCCVASRCVQVQETSCCVACV